ncbi:hypothetical protein [Lacticaseibacillus saniviri]|nr:hypothetical protein [Lacticaseibacillus saniviri]
MSPFAQIKRPVQHLLEQYAVQAKVLNSMNIPFANSIAASALSSAIPVDAVVEYSRRQSEQYAKIAQTFSQSIYSQLPIFKSIPDSALTAVLTAVRQNIETIANRVQFNPKSFDVRQLEEYGWALPLPLTAKSVLFEAKRRSKIEFDQYMYKQYTRRNCEVLVTTLYQWADGYVESEYKDLCKQMAELLEQDWTKYKLCVSNLFMLMERAGIIFDNGTVQVKWTFGYTSIRHILNNNKIEEWIFTEAANSALRLLRPLYESEDFSQLNGINVFTRHSYMHGRFPPDRVTFAMFIRLVNQMDILISFYKDYKVQITND